MRCEHCGAELNLQEQECPYCHHSKPEAKVISPAEVQQFQGVTIEQEPTVDSEYSRSRHTNERIFVRRVNVRSSAAGFFTKLLIAAVLALFVFFAFSAIVVFAFAGGVFYLLSRLFRR